MERFRFPNWTNKLVAVLLASVLLGLGYIGAVGAYGTAPGTIQVGYSPQQPVPFSHKLHAGKLKMDCRYCHNTVDQAAHAAIPPTATCVNCHSAAATDGSVPTRLGFFEESQASAGPRVASHGQSDPLGPRAQFGRFCVLQSCGARESGRQLCVVSRPD